ncbi:MAG TPA: 50S ribosomal protein L22 [Phycisphaerae bacterium]|nr:50S ribosomal protein L22 [Phycisphaerae bacterium]HPS53143.1 50S ribosomal protein L22 [Phycisphaerae bacterium]
MAWNATHKFARMSARKMRLVADMVRGRDVQDALNILKFSPNRASGMISKVIKSAVASANEGEADVDTLIVKEIRIDEGPVMKRFRPKDRGRAYNILKRTSHISVVVDVD